MTQLSLGIAPHHPQLLAILYPKLILSVISKLLNCSHEHSVVQVKRVYTRPQGVGHCCTTLKAVEIALRVDFHQLSEPAPMPLILFIASHLDIVVGSHQLIWVLSDILKQGFVVFSEAFEIDEIVNFFLVKVALGPFFSQVRIHNFVLNRTTGGTHLIRFAGGVYQ